MSEKRVSVLTCWVTDILPGTIDSILFHPHGTFIYRPRIKSIHGDTGVFCRLRRPILDTIPTALGPVGEVLQGGVLRRLPTQADGGVGLTFNPQVSHWVWS